jgi:hypothetical protein
MAMVITSIAKQRRLAGGTGARWHARVPRVIGVLLAGVVVLSGLARTVGVPVAASLKWRSPQVAPACAERVQSRLFFGLRAPTGPVSDSAWETFLADVVTPRFPDGLTVFQASGQWRGTSDRLEREPSRVVEIVHDESRDAGRRIDEIVAIYKTRHQQESVMVARARINVCF